MRRSTRTWQEFAVEALGTLASTVVCLVTGLVGAVVLAWATGSLFRVVLAPGATDLRAAITAVAALFVVGAGLFLGVAIVQKASDIHHRHRQREVAAASAASAASDHAPAR